MVLDDWYIEIRLSNTQVEYLQNILGAVANCSFADEVYIEKAKEIIELISD